MRQLRPQQMRLSAEPALQMPVFIGGTGRSGTTLLHELVSSHPAIYGIPGETKFIVEGDGLAALIPALTHRFSITASDLALLRFMALMGLDVADTPFQEGREFAADLASRLGAPDYHSALARFVAGLVDFNMTTAHNPVGSPYPRHFENRAELIALTRAFLTDLFGFATARSGKAIWCEKTPANLLEIDLLWEIFPNARILHIKRDPRGVLHSLMQQDWAPSDLHQATALLRQIYIRWRSLKPRLALPDPRYLEFKLEDLAATPEPVLSAIAATLGLEPAFRQRSVNPALASRWKSEMPANHRAHCERELADIFDLMGYTV
jgi:omega-hydroxy-beta-dihydromenaquinone-9 sulfotransferase